MNVKHILIIKLSAIGDVIHALPVAQALKKHYPHCRITWIVEKPARDLLLNNPHIDEVLVFDKPAFKSFKNILINGSKLASELKKREFDLALDLQGLFKSAAIAWLSGARQRLVYCNAREGSQWISKRICGPHADGHVIKRYLDVAQYLGCEAAEAVFDIHVSEKEQELTEKIARQAGFDLKNSYIVLAPGTNWATKCWPIGHFAALCDMLAGLNIIPVLVGGPGDSRLAEDIAAETLIPPVDLTGKTTLKQLAWLIRHAKLFIGGDTGTMHLAAAVGTRTVALFGPTSPERNGPYGPGHTVLTVAAECAGCWRRTCDKPDCMAQISPEAVFAAVQRNISV